MSTDLRTPARTDEGFRVTLPQVWSFLRRYVFVIAGVFALTVAGAYGTLSLMSEQYEAHSGLLVKLGRENLDPPPTARNAVFSTGLRREEIASEIQILKSQDLIGQTVDAIGLEAFRPVRVVPEGLLAQAKYYTKAAIRAARDQAVEVLMVLDLKKRLDERQRLVSGLESALVIEPEKESDVIALRLRMPDPALAVRIQETLIGLYLQRRIQVRQPRGVKEFLDERTEMLRAELERAEQAVNEWKSATSLSAPDAQRSLLLEQLRTVIAERHKTLNERETLLRQAGTARTLAGGAPERVDAVQTETPNATLQVLRERLAKLEADRAHITATYQPQASTVRTLDEEIATLRAVIEGQPTREMGTVTRQLNPLHQQLVATLQEAQVRVDGLSAGAALQAEQVEALRTELETLEQGDARLVELERERKIAEQNYLAASGRRYDADLAAQLDLNRISNVSIAVPPSATLEPVYPRKLLIMGVALALGLFLGVLVSLVLEWTGDEVWHVEQLEALGDVACLGVVRFPQRERGAA